MVQVVRVVRIISPDDMHSENIWILWSEPSKSWLLIAKLKRNLEGPLGFGCYLAQMIA